MQDNQPQSSEWLDNWFWDNFELDSANQYDKLKIDKAKALILAHIEEAKYDVVKKFIEWEGNVDPQDLDYFFEENEDK